MLSIQSLIQNAKQLSKSYEKNAMNAEGVIQQMANFANATAPQQTSVQSKQSAQTASATNSKPNEQQKASTASSSTATAAENVVPVITDPKVMIASLLEQEQQAAAATQKASTAAATATASTSTQNGLLAPGSTSTCKPRSMVMYTLQRESTKVKALKRENHMLKQQLQEYQFALELIMSKYREQMMELLTKAEACAATILAHHESPEQMEQQAQTIALTNRLQEMKGRFERSIGPSSEEKILEQRQLLHELIVEHETLVELYKISKKYGSLPGTTPPLDDENLVSTTKALMEALKVVELANSAATVFSTAEQSSKSAAGQAENMLESASPFSITSSSMETESENDSETEKENQNPELESPMDVSTGHIDNSSSLVPTETATAVSADNV